MEKNYETKLMYRVWVMKDGTSEALFETKEMAETFAELMEKQGIPCSVNKWRWEVKVEK